MSFIKSKSSYLKIPKNAITIIVCCMLYNVIKNFNLILYIKLVIRKIKIIYYDMRYFILNVWVIKWSFLA